MRRNQIPSLELGSQNKSTKSEASITGYPGPKESPRRQSIALGWFFVFALAALVAFGVALRESQLLFAAVAAFTGWCLMVCLCEYLFSRFEFSVRLAQKRCWVLQRFLSLAAEDKDDLLRVRLHFDALQEELAKPAKIIVGISGQTAKEFHLDLRSAGAWPSP